MQAWVASNKTTTGLFAFMQRSKTGPLEIVLDTLLTWGIIHDALSSVAQLAERAAVNR
jgi:hypothetical protein